jgi:hypothetical protein
MINGGEPRAMPAISVANCVAPAVETLSLSDE